MSKRQKLRKAKRLEAKREAFRQWQEGKRLYRVSFPWKKAGLMLLSFIFVSMLVWLVPKGIILLSSMKSISGPFGTISRGELDSYKFATMKTNYGDIKFELLTDSAPKTVANFILLTKDNFYNGIKFHRVIDDFMIQTGDPLSKDDDPNNDGMGGPGYQFEDEFNKNTPLLVRGIVAMANSGVDTNGSQFFIITTESTPWLDGKHTPFGRVIEGMEVADEISQLKTNDNDLPLRDVIIEELILS